jgi:hypothetical protein
LKLFFIYLAFSFFFWMIGELVRTSPWRLLLTLDGFEFDHFSGGDNSMPFVGVFPEKPGCALVERRMQE